MGIIVRNLSSSGLSNARVSNLYDLDEYGIIGDKKFYYLVPKIKSTSYTLPDDPEIVLSNSSYYLPWNDFHPVKVNYLQYNKDSSYPIGWRVGGFDRYTSSYQYEPMTILIPSSGSISVENPAILEIEFTKPVLLKWLNMRNRAFSSTTTSFRDFTLQGLDSDGEWIELLNIVGKTNTVGGIYNYDLTWNNNLYSVYRFIVTSSYLSTQTTQSQINLLTTKDTY